jgi:2,4-dienoyl-CoA reductase-like NADH-dependent reductase (Old Yellow Enzyme family)
MLSGDIDYLDMSLWDVFKAPAGPAYIGSQLIDHRRGKTRLGVVGKILSAATAQECIDRGADTVLTGRGAILHSDFPAKVMADPNFESIALPVTREYLRNEDLDPAFVDYMATG